MEKLREVYSPDSQASKGYEAYKRKALAEKQKEQSENIDQSVYDDSKEATQENTDLEEDQALLEEEEKLW